MDDGDDAAALAIAASRTRSLAPASSAEVLRKTLGDHRGDLTLADAAARSGLPLRDAELGLHELLRTQRGHLSVTEAGELLFRFPTGLQHPYGAVMRALRVLGAGVLGLARWTGRLALTLFLLGYGVLFAVGALFGAIALAVLSEDASPLEGVAYLVWGFFDLLTDAVYWSVHPLRGPDEFGELGEARQPRSFYQRINGFFLGPPRRSNDPRSAARLLVREIRFRRGRIGLSDVVRVTGLPPEPAGALVSRLLVDYDGTVAVTDDGAIVYAFPALQPSVDTPTILATPAIWHRIRELQPFTGNLAGGNMQVILLTAFVAAFGYLGLWLGLPIWAAEVPFFGSLALLAWVFLRIPAHLVRRRADRRENGRRALLQLAYDGACERRGIPTREFADAWRDAADGTIAEKHLERLLSDLGGELMIDDDGGTTWRFPTIALELGALALVRAQVPASEREVGPVELTSIPEEDDEPRALPQS